MKDVNIVLGVTGGIAVYKACDLVSRLKKMNASIDVIMTASALEFVAPLTFQSMALNRVVTDMFAEPKTWDIEHISLAKKADVFVIAPATANIIGKIANGIADDMLSTTVMATKAPVLIAPAMNTGMYENPVVQENIEKLKRLGYHFVEPESGRLACNDIGKGKLAHPEEIVRQISKLLYKKKDLIGKRILITAGPTVEALDPVRFLTNKSTGRMGYQLAEIAALRGAEVTLVTGPTRIEKPKDVRIIEIVSTQDMFDAVMSEKDSHDVFIGAAAPADYRPAKYAVNKIKKSDDDMAIPLERNPDIAQTLGLEKGHMISVGFSVETENVFENSMKKLKKKNFDMIVVNDVTKEGAGFGTDTNIVTLIDRSGDSKAYDLMSKRDVAELILDKIATKIN
ncbi:bifunctional phosphopantothenoylcysteine decarboxylase/phosphopantothenate--cysteine ligase CoaBC [Fusibacter sp. A2]|uniref:bifunctional phosphopantothenoylcysteine decarboxylase/phosphopantothenate--cysteine ligase CoaBC n=1 Tax=unclassified Fusibacter TaxID=2624464 RepID=UPI0032B83F52